MHQQKVRAPCSQGRLKVRERGKQKRLLMQPPLDRRIERKHREQMPVCGRGRNQQGVVIKTQMPSQMQGRLTHVVHAFRTDVVTAVYMVHGFIEIFSGQPAL
jgi:hypothetical protein